MHIPLTSPARSLQTLNQVRIEDYGLIGDLRTAALVSKKGSIDWLCLPRFDSGACFAALLGDESNGCWHISPSSSFSSHQFYRADTLVLETCFDTPQGSAKIIDCMVPHRDSPTLIRIVEGLKGLVHLKMELAIRFDYGSVVPWVTKNPFGGIKAVAGPETLRLKTTVKLQGKDLKTHADFTVAQGEKIPFILTWSESHRPPPLEVEDPYDLVERVTLEWQAWISHCTYRGTYSEIVKRSLLTLKALSSADTGGIVSAPTTSLPECIGGKRNWDYRYAWLRDSVLALSSLLKAGYREEAQRWRDWLLRAVAGTPSDIRVMYGIAGERRLPELEIPWLKGYENSRPVRIGNAAHDQLQLDIFGGLMKSFQISDYSGLEHDEGAWHVQKKIIEFIEKVWTSPDRGIWEVRGPERHFTHSKVMAWVAIDSALKQLRHRCHNGELEHWQGLANKIHEQVCENGYNRSRGSFVQYYGSNNLDASLLLIPIVKFLPADDPRVLNTFNAIEKELLQDGFMRRYSTDQTDDGLNSKEGTFIPCSFWYVDNLIIQHRPHEARAAFERIIKVRNHLGLFAEEYDPLSQRMLGNFPQAFSHLALIQSAFMF